MHVLGRIKLSYFISSSCDATKPLPEPDGSIPTGILIAVCQSGRDIKPFTT